MKLYSFIEPHRLDEKIVVEVILTENDILDFYWDTWKANMKKAGQPREMISESNCIEDWIVANWAAEFNDVYREGVEYGIVMMDYDMWLEYVRRMREHENN